MPDTELYRTLSAAAPPDMRILPAPPAAVRAAAAAGVTYLFTRGSGVVDECASDDEREVLVRRGEELAGAAARHFLGGGGGEPLDEMAEAQEVMLRGMLERLPDGVFPRSLVGGPPERFPTLVTLALEEAALERFRHSAVLALNPEGGFTFFGRPVSPHRAYALLEDRAYERAADALRNDEIFHLEAAACRWRFDQWSSEPPRGETLDRTRRRDAFLYAERPRLRFGAPPLAVLEEDGTAGEWPPIQARLAGALPRSVAGAFEVREQSDDVFHLREVADGREYRIREDADGTLAPGVVLLGRLIPWEDAFVSSVSRVLVGADAADLGVMRRLFRDLREILPSGLAVEAMISRGVLGHRVPRRVLPAEGVAEAGESLLSALEVLEAEELAVFHPDRPQSPRPGTELELYDLEVDETVEEWLEAIAGLARKRGAPKRREKARGKKKGKRR